MLISIKASIFVDVPDEKAKDIDLDKVYIHGIEEKHIRYGTNDRRKKHKKIPGQVYDWTTESVEVLTDD